MTTKNQLNPLVDSELGECALSCCHVVTLSNTSAGEKSGIINNIYYILFIIAGKVPECK